MLSKPIYKLGKRLGAGIHEKCQTQKFALSEARAKKGFSRRKMMSDYGKQLLEKQKLRFSYGITEKQLVKYVKNAAKTPNQVDELNRLLEMRLDNTVYKLGFASTRRAARQMVSHGHITVNGRKVTIPSYQLRVDDKIEVREGSKAKSLFTNAKERIAEHTAPKWLVMDAKKLQGSVKSNPEFVQTDSIFDFSAVFEFYSR